MTPFVQTTLIPHTPERFKANCEAVAKLRPLWSMKAIEEFILREGQDDNVWVNDKYQVSIRNGGDGWIHLSIKRIDKNPIHDWRDLQEIKNELVGPENEALELYPAESRRVDTANQYHLWVRADPADRMPVGFVGERLMLDSDATDKTGAKQRPFERGK